MVKSALCGTMQVYYPEYNLQNNKENNPSTCHASFSCQVFYINQLNPHDNPKTQLLLFFPLWRSENGRTERFCISSKTPVGNKQDLNPKKSASKVCVLTALLCYPLLPTPEYSQPSARRIAVQ